MVIVNELTTAYVLKEEDMMRLRNMLALLRTREDRRSRDMAACLYTILDTAQKFPPQELWTT